MDLLDYRKELIEDVKTVALSNEEGTTSSFVQVVSEKLMEIEAIPDFYPSFFNGFTKRGKRMRVDGYALDEFEQALYIFVAEYRDIGETLIRSEAIKIFGRTSAFVTEVIEGNLKENLEMSTAAYDLADLLDRNQNKIRKFKFLLLTDCLLSERIGTIPNREVGGITVEHHIWDITRLYRVLSSDQGVERNVVVFSDFIANGIPCIEASNTGAKNYRSFLCVIPGTVLADIYDKYGSKLLEGNVRSFLSTKVAVNKKIRKTILSEPQMFLAYNNGISATATEVVVGNVPEGKCLLNVKDLQIVNGGQTTASLSSARYKDKALLDDIFVQMKLTIVEEAEAVEVIPNIARSSNNQNKVSEADFFSNHQFHIRIEKLSRRMYAPAVGGAQHETHWFYERVRGQYLQSQMKMSKSDKTKFEYQNPKKQVVTKTDLAKFQNSWQCLPHIVSKGAQTQFIHFAESVTQQWDKDNERFNEDYFKDCMALGILFKTVESLVSKQPWYENGYRANIVTYSVALLSYLVKREYPEKSLNLSLIWKKQMVPDELIQQMTILTKEVFDHITDSKREVINVTQWCKREKCWTNLKSLDFKLLPIIENILIDKSEKRKIEFEAREDQKLVSGFEAQMFIIDFGEVYWRNIRKWGTQRRLLSDEDTSLLETVESLIRRSKIPNSYQSKKLQDIRNRMLLEGYLEA